MKNLFLLLALLSLSVQWTAAQVEHTHSHDDLHIDGKVTGVNSRGKIVPLRYAYVIWMGTSTGTQTDNKGQFVLDRVDSISKIVVSYVGYQTDTIDTKGKSHLNIELIPVSSAVVKIKRRRRTNSISSLDPIKTEKIAEEELHKGACCNLSESFETTPSVDVSFTDAVTGARQIQLLGLAGQYTQMMQGNIANLRGMASVHGLSHIPGTWVCGIGLNKGPGSVVNGYESITGQINIELKKPDNMEKFFLNGFSNLAGRFELNTHFSHEVSPKASTATFIHARSNQARHDRNKDGFLDMPLNQTLAGMHRWNWIGKNGFRGQIGMRAVTFKLLGGQTEFKERNDLANFWGMEQEADRVELFAKTGKTFDNQPWKSMGLQFATSYHNQFNYFGFRRYDIQEWGVYANYIYQSIIGNTNNIIKTGASFKYDQADEYFSQFGNAYLNREEIVPGVFGEYTYKGGKKLNGIAGLRADHHNSYGLFLTPRLHLKYDVSKKRQLRMSGGRGLRTASILAENMGYLASNRNFVLQSEANNNPYGLKPEIAWNYGLNYTERFRLFKHEASITFDFYRTDFENQVVIDAVSDPSTILMYNLNGQSFSNSFQVQADIEPLERFDIRMAYRLFDVQTTYGNQLDKKPLISAHRAFINLAYETKNKWFFDYTLSWNGSKRLPATPSRPNQYNNEETSPDFILMNAQISKKWTKFHIYVGAENLGNFRQDNPILGAENPLNGNNFDASQTWGPIFGTNTYLGFRYIIK